MNTMKALLSLLLLAVAIPAMASVAVPVSVEDLARGSDAVVRGRVERVTTRWTEDGRRIFTYAEVRPSSVLRGTAPELMTVITPGGVVGDIGQRVDGVAAFAEGEEVVVFVHRAEAGTYRVSGLAQGKFSVSGGVASPDLSHTALVPAPLTSGERHAEAMQVQELERRVRSTR